MNKPTQKQQEVLKELKKHLSDDLENVRIKAYDDLLDMYIYDNELLMDVERLRLFAKYFGMELKDIEDE